MTILRLSKLTRDMEELIKEMHDYGEETNDTILSVQLDDVARNMRRDVDKLLKSLERLEKAELPCICATAGMDTSPGYWHWDKCPRYISKIKGEPYVQS